MAAYYGDDATHGCQLSPGGAWLVPIERLVIRNAFWLRQRRM